MSSQFTEVVKRDDGSWAVIELRDGFEVVRGTFDSEEEAQSWLLEVGVSLDRAGDDLGLSKPRGGQGL